MLGIQVMAAAATPTTMAVALVPEVITITTEAIPEAIVLIREAELLLRQVVEYPHLLMAITGVGLIHVIQPECQHRQTQVTAPLTMVITSLVQPIVFRLPAGLMIHRETARNARTTCQIRPGLMVAGVEAIAGGRWPARDRPR